MEVVTRTAARTASLLVSPLEARALPPPRRAAAVCSFGAFSRTPGDSTLRHVNTFTRTRVSIYRGALHTHIGKIDPCSNTPRARHSRRPVATHTHTNKHADPRHIESRQERVIMLPPGENHAAMVDGHALPSSAAGAPSRAALGALAPSPLPWAPPPAPPLPLVAGGDEISTTTASTLGDGRGRGGRRRGYCRGGGWGHRLSSNAASVGGGATSTRALFMAPASDAALRELGPRLRPPRRRRCIIGWAERQPHREPSWEERGH